MADGNKTPPQKPTPKITPDNAPFWKAAAQGQLCLQRCTSCAHLRYPISRVCPQCLSDDADWVQVSGRGIVHSAITFHQVYHPAYKDDVPYNVSIIQLDEGPRLFSNVVGVPPDEVKVGDRVEACFDRLSDDVGIPRFKHSRD